MTNNKPNDLKSVGELIDSRRDDETEYIKAHVRNLGGDGLVCPGECGCSLDDMAACGESLDDLACYPAKGYPGTWEGEKCTVYWKVGTTPDESDDEEKPHES